MSFTWDRIGIFTSVVEAEEWCDRRGGERRDRDSRGGRDGFDLLIRQGSSDDERPDGARW